MIRILLLLSLILLAGCATTNRQVRTSAADEVIQMQAVHGDLVEEMIRQRQYHAALAHIEQLQREDRQNADRLLLLHAQVLLKLGRIPEAHAEYAQLMGGPYDADAMHGIGLIYAINDPAMSLDYLGKAARGKPTDAGFRNDFGYALLKQGQFGEAQLQLLTASELAPNELRYLNNALLAMILAGDEAAARRLIEQAGMPLPYVEKLRGQAKEWRTSIEQPASSANQAGGNDQLSL